MSKTFGRGIAYLLLGFGIAVCGPMGCSVKPVEPADTGDSKDLLPDLIAMVQVADENQEAAAEALGRVGPEAKDAADALKKACEAKDPRVRVAAALALVQIFPDDSETNQLCLATLQKAIAAEDADARREAVRGLGKLGQLSPELVNLVAERLCDDEIHVAMHAADVLANVGEPAVPVLIQYLDNEKGRHWAVLALGEIGGPAKSALPKLVELLELDDPIQRREVLHALLEIGENADLPVESISVHLTDPLPPVRIASALLLGKKGEDAKGEIGALTELLTDPQPLVQLAAAVALASIDPSDAALSEKTLPILIEGLTDANDPAQYEAAVALGNLGKLAQPAIGPLEKVAKEDNSAEVRQVAAEAAAKIKGS